MSQKEILTETTMEHSELIHDKDQARAMAEAELPYRESASQAREKIDKLPDGFNPLRMMKRIQQKGIIKEKERMAEREAARTGEVFERVRDGKESLRAQSYLAGAINRAREYDHEPGIASAAEELEAYRDASAAEAFELYDKPRKGLASLVEAVSQSMAGKHQFKETFTYEKSGMIFGWDTLGSATEKGDYAVEKGVEHVTSDEVAAIYDILGISTDLVEFRGMSSLGFTKTGWKDFYLHQDAKGVTDWQQDYGYHGVNLRITTHSAADLGEVYIPQHVTFDLAANPAKQSSE